MLVTVGSVKEPMGLKLAIEHLHAVLGEIGRIQDILPLAVLGHFQPGVERSPAAPLSTMTIACVGSTSGFQPLMVPSIESKIRRAGADLPLAEITKFFVGL